MEDVFATDECKRELQKSDNKTLYTAESEFATDVHLCFTDHIYDSFNKKL